MNKIEPKKLLMRDAFIILMLVSTFLSITFFIGGGYLATKKNVQNCKTDLDKSIQDCNNNANLAAMQMLDSVSENINFCENTTNQITGIVVSKNERGEQVLFPKCFFVQKLNEPTQSNASKELNDFEKLLNNTLGEQK